MLTAEWVVNFDICPDVRVPVIEDEVEPPGWTAAEAAARTVILHCVVAVGAGVAPHPVIEWLKDQKLWEQVTPKEKAFLASPQADEKTARSFFWQKEAQWTLLWVLGKIEALGLPTSECDTKRIVDQIMPELGGDTSEFIQTARLRPPGEMLAEDDRTYNIWCYALRHKPPQSLPSDLHMGVLYQRRYAFEWLNGEEPWDQVSCDA